MHVLDVSTQGSVLSTYFALSIMHQITLLSSFYHRDIIGRQLAGLEVSNHGMRYKSSWEAIIDMPHCYSIVSQKVV